MKYMVILKDRNVIGTCFGGLKFWARDGAMSIAWLDSQGNMKEMHRGQLVGGHFDAAQDDG